MEKKVKKNKKVFNVTACNLRKVRQLFITESQLKMILTQSTPTLSVHPQKINWAGSSPTGV